MDQNSVSFQIFLILLYFIELGSESQISVFKHCQSNTQMSGFFGGSMRGSRFFGEKETAYGTASLGSISRVFH